MEISFETQYALQEFREIEDQYFYPNDTKAYSTLGTSAENILERMLLLINTLEADLNSFKEENESLRNEIGVLHKGMSRI